MAIGNIYPAVAVMAPTHTGITAVVETATHSFSGGKHVWTSDWFENAYMKPISVRLDSDQQANMCTIKMEGTRVEDWADYIAPADQLRVVLKSEETIINDDGVSVGSPTQQRIRLGATAPSPMGYGLLQSLNGKKLGIKSATNEIFFESNTVSIDNIISYFGTGKDASIKYDGSNMIINSRVVGVGNLTIIGNLNVTGCINYNGGSLGTCI